MGPAAGEVALAFAGPPLSPGDLDADGFADIACTEKFEAAVMLAHGAAAGLGEPTAWVRFADDYQPPDVVADAGASGLGDMRDLVIGWPVSDDNQGGVLLYPNGWRDLGVSFPGEQSGTYLGTAIVADLDLDGDRHEEVIAVARIPGEDLQQVRVYDGDEWHLSGCGCSSTPAAATGAALLAAAASMMRRRPPPR